MNASISPLIKIIELNTHLFKNSFECVDDKLAQTRINDKTNSMLFIACHLLDARYYLANKIDAKIECPFQEVFDRATCIDDFAEYPALDDIKASWLDISEIITTQLKRVTDDTLYSQSPFPLPIVEPTIFGFITFIAEHESYHIGQLGFLRKYFGLEPMKYA